MEANPLKYMNPITFEAEMFVNSLETLSKKYVYTDAVLVKALEKVMNAIDQFLDKANNEIMANETTVLVDCDNINHINRIYHCTRCKTDLGKTVEKATLHLIEPCAKRVAGATGGSRQTAVTDSAAQPNAKTKSKEKTIFEVRKERKLKIREKRMNQAVKITKKTRAFLSTDFNQFFADHIKIGTKLQSIPDYKIIENDLESIVAPIFPDQTVRIYPFGSRLAGIATRESDLDMFVDIGGTYSTFQNRGDSETLAKLRKVEKGLNKSKLFKHMRVIDKARVPILRIFHTSSGIECDINFSNSLGNINTKYLEYIFNLQPLAWLCSYTTMNLEELNIPLEETTEKKMKKFIKGFFEFYIKFDYDYVVCPYFGKPVKRTEIEKRMPMRYKNYVEDHPDYALEMDNALVIQDPIQLNHNVAKSLTAFNHEIILTYMIKSLQVINETLAL